MFIEYDETMFPLLELAANKDYNGLFAALEALDSNDPKTPLVLAMINTLSGLAFEIVPK